MAGKLGFRENQLSGLKVKGRMTDMNDKSHKKARLFQNNCSGADILCDDDLMTIR